MVNLGAYIAGASNGIENGCIQPDLSVPNIVKPENFHPETYSQNFPQRLPPPQSTNKIQVLQHPHSFPPIQPHKNTYHPKKMHGHADQHIQRIQPRRQKQGVRDQIRSDRPGHLSCRRRSCSSSRHDTAGAWHDREIEPIAGTCPTDSRDPNER